MSAIINEDEVNKQILGLANTISATGTWTTAPYTISTTDISQFATKAYIDQVLSTNKGADKKKQKEIVEQTCITFTELLLSITPFKAKEFVEKNCNRVRRAIMKKLNEVDDE